MGKVTNLLEKICQCANLYQLKLIDKGFFTQDVLYIFNKKRKNGEKS